MSLSLEKSQTLTVGELSSQSALDLMQVQAEAADYLRNAKQLKEWIDGAIALRYEQKANDLRAQLGKDTGTVNFDDEGVRVSAELPKKPVWDQKQLAEMANRIREGGDDPKDFIDVAYKISERKYTAWPAYLQASFKPARTLKIGKPTFRLQIVEVNV